MRKITLRRVTLCAATALMLSAPLAQAEIGATVKAGTLGLGLELTTDLTENLNLRAGFNNYTYSYSSVESDIDYNLDLDLRSISLLADWHVFSGNFRISAGMMSNSNELFGTGRPTGGTYEIGNETYTAEQVGTLSMGMDFNSTAPYVGIGFGNAVGTNGRWRISTDVGVLFQGSPRARLSADGSFSDEPEFQAELRREEASLQEDIDSFEYYPVISIGLSYRF